MDEQRKRFSETESSPGDDAMKTVEGTTQDLGYYVRLGDKAAAGSSPVGEMPSNSITCDREIVKGSQSMRQIVVLF